MIIDCDSCEVRGHACGDCVVGVLLGAPVPRGAGDAAPVPRGAGDAAPGHEGDVPPGAPIVQLDAPERHALDVLADQGLVPRLRLVATRPRRATSDPGADRPDRDAG